ncbi:MAG: hypothetical protein LBE92_07105 [Chryseobacterium sp.]|jgi:hypothetical protein|uniref:hypothetical protein n=1 Tax=Chryseobacterium sp. TaxID=1871047 RepID=UPI00282D41A2|nr:hypothetical protein [Chryseobacterium sp.]MDR2235875.1 hypothetical protein [Chryseobacterium sp.]
MKTTALVLGMVSAFIFSSCKCDPDEDEPRNKTTTKSTAAKTGMPESDTLQIK